MSRRRSPRRGPGRLAGRRVAHRAPRPSAESALESLTCDGGPLQYVGSTVPVPAITAEDWRSALTARFAEFGSPITADALDRLLNLSCGHPFCTMLLAHETAMISDMVGETTTAAVNAGLYTAEKDEGWGLRHDPLG